MRSKFILSAILIPALILPVSCKNNRKKDLSVESGNPVFNGWYADPGVVIYGGQYWIYPTTSSGYDEQTYLDAFSSTDLVKWTKHDHVLDAAAFSWAQRALWAPSPVFANNLYYIFFSANDIQSDNEVGGIGVGVADNPGGPYVDATGKPLIGKFHNGAQPIDPDVFIDNDGSAYMYYGGWRHCNVVHLSSDLLDIEPLPDGSLYREITPEGYVEGPCMVRRNDKYYFMWSEGDWTGPDYSVAYAMSDSPLGPFTRIGKILQQDTAVATGAGHHSVLNIPETDDWFIVYHCRPKGHTDPNHRIVCIDRMYFNEDGTIKPVEISFEGAGSHPLGDNLPDTPE